MAQAKIFTGQDIVNGLATIYQGEKNNTRTFDPGSGLGYTQHFASGDALTLFVVENQRYRYHGGAGGSGAWEH